MHSPGCLEDIEFSDIEFSLNAEVDRDRFFQGSRLISTCVNQFGMRCNT